MHNKNQIFSERTVTLFCHWPESCQLLRRGKVYPTQIGVLALVRVPEWQSRAHQEGRAHPG